MAFSDSIARYADTGGFSLVAARAIEKVIFDSPVGLSPLQTAYWSVAPRYYQHQPAETDHYPREVNPFKISWVDPSAVTQFTRREYPFWVDIKHRFGTVEGGDWDVRDEPPVDTTYDGSPMELYFADRFEDTVLHRSLRERFRNDTPWAETEFVAAAERIVSNGGIVWNGCRNKSDIEVTCTAIDRLYESMKANGCRSYRAVLREEGALDIDFLQCLKNEILVDIGRNGELLFVDGRHRLSIAKLLGIERVPVAVLVRHEQWMESRDPGMTTEVPGHPDFQPDLTDR
jgi:hypothetical protein